MGNCREMPRMASVLGTISLAFRAVSKQVLDAIPNCPLESDVHLPSCKSYSLVRNLPN